MIAAETIEVTRNLWQSWAVTGGSIVSAVVILSILAKVPGGRAVFRFLVADPVARWMDARMDAKITSAVGLQADTVEANVQQHVTAALEPFDRKIDQINHAVNNVEPGTPPIKERVHRIELGQQVTDAKIDTLTVMVESLVQRK